MSPDTNNKNRKTFQLSIIGAGIAVGIGIGIGIALAAGVPQKNNSIEDEE